MGKYSDALLSSGTEVQSPRLGPSATNPKKYSEAIFSGGNIEPEATSDSDRGASFMALADAKVADDPNTRMRVFSKARFPNLSEDEALKKYKVIGDRVAYQADDGKYYYESEAGFLKDFGTDLLAHSGAVIGAGAGAMKGAALGSAAGPPGTVIGGLLGAFGGGAAGEGIRKLVASQALDEPQTTSDVVMDMGKEGLFAMAGEGVGRLAGKGLQTYLARGAKDVSQLGAASRKEILGADLGEFSELTKKAKQQGINLTLPEALGTRELINRQSLLRDLPSSSSKIEGFLKVRSKQVRDAVYRYMNGLSGETTPDLAYRKGIDAAQAARKGLESERSAAASKFYEAAANDVADIKPTVVLLTKRIAKASGTKTGSVLEGVKRSLTDATGGLKTNIDELHIAKLDLDDQIENAVSRGYKSQARELTRAKESLLSSMDSSSLYQRGRKTFETLSQPINQLDESLAKTVIKEGDRPVPDLGRVLFGKASSPKSVKEVRSYIAKQDPQAWNDVIRGHIQSTIEEMSEGVTGETLNIGGQLRKKLVGTETKRAMMKNALSPKQYQALMDLSEVLNATGRAMKGQSITAQRQQMIKELEREATQGFQAGADVVTSLATPTQITGRIRQWYTEISLGKHAARMADVITSPKSMATLRKQAKILKEATSKTKHIPALGASLAVIVGAE